MNTQIQNLKGVEVLQTELYPEEELLSVNTVAQRVVGAYNEHGSQYRDARDTYRDWLNRPAPTRFSGPTSRYGMDYRPETTARINRHHEYGVRLNTTAEEAGQHVKELMLQAVTPMEGIELELSFDSLHASALIAPQGTSRQYRLDLDQPDRYLLTYFTEEPVFLKWGGKNVQRELEIPVSLARITKL